MSRIISINKSNYFILSGNTTYSAHRRTIEKELGLEIYGKLFDVIFKLYSDYIKRQAGKTIGRLVKIIEEYRMKMLLMNI